uniref:Hydrolase n=1 Tax=Steinernema glaseri TaxID=37863 RepID=A0A1I7Y567_9BILA
MIAPMFGTHTCANYKGMTNLNDLYDRLFREKSLFSGGHNPYRDGNPVPINHYAYLENPVVKMLKKCLGFQ